MPIAKINLQQTPIVPVVSAYREVTLRECTSLILRDHYSHKLPKNVKLTFADLQHSPRLPLACCTFSGPTGPFENATGILELSRLVRTPTYDKPLTRLVSKAMGWIRGKKSADLLLSLADIEEDHHGGIYQACSWVYGGTRDERLDGFNIGGQFVPARTCNHRYGTSSVEAMTKLGGVPHFDAGKHLYWKALTKAGMQQAINMGLRSFPYPKPMLLGRENNTDLKATHNRKGVIELPAAIETGPAPIRLSAPSLTKQKSPGD
jgi:hypothetical protein